MIDIRELVAGLSQAICKADFPDAARLARALNMEISQARVTQMKAGDVIIKGARLDGSSIALDVICGISIRREIWLLFGHSSISYCDVKEQQFGANQRINPSKVSAGFAVLFEVDGFTCGYTVSSEDGDLEAIFCEEPRQPRVV